MLYKLHEIKDTLWRLSQKNTKEALKQWNKNVFENITQKLQHLRNIIEELQNRPQSDTNLQLECAAVQDLAELEKREAVFWKEKAKA